MGVFENDRGLRAAGGKRLMRLMKQVQERLETRQACPCPV